MQRMMLKDNTDEVSLNDIFTNAMELARFSWKRRGFLVAFSFLGAAFAFTYAHFSNKITFTSRITFVIEGGSQPSGISSLASQFGLGGGSGGSSMFSGDNVMLLLQSRRIIEQTLLKDYCNNPDSNLYNKYVVRNFPEAVMQNTALLIPAGTDRSVDVRSVDSALAVIVDAVTALTSVNSLNKSNIIELIVEGTDEHWALDFNRTHLQEFSDLQVKLKAGHIKASIDVLEHRLDSVKRALNNSMYGVAERADQSLGIIQSTPNVETRKKEMETQLLAGLYSEIYKSLEMTRYSWVSAQPVVKVIDNTRAPLEKTGKGRVKFAALGGILAFVIAFGGIFLKYLFQEKS